MIFKFFPINELKTLGHELSIDANIKSTPHFSDILKEFSLNLKQVKIFNTIILIKSVNNQLKR